MSSGPASTLQPNRAILARAVLTACLTQLERQKEADEALKSVVNIAPKYTIQDFKNAYPFLYEEDILPGVEGLRKAGMPDN